MSDAWDGLLEDGETILWQGRPDGRFRIVPRLLPVSAFGAVFLAFSLFWMAMALGISGGGLSGTLFALFGLPFVLAGLGMVGGTHLWNMIRRRGAFYTLTDRRAFIATDLPVIGRALHPVRLDPQSFAITWRGGLADVVLGTATARTRAQGYGRSGRVRYSGAPAQQVPVRFEALSDGETVMGHLTRLQKEIAT